MKIQGLRRKTVKTLIEIPPKLLSMISNFVKKLYPRFVTYRSFLKIKKEKLKIHWKQQT